LPVEAPTPLPAGPAPFISLEGPLWVPTGGGFLLFSDVVENNAEGAKIYEYDPRAREYAVHPYPSATPTSTNGMAMDPAGNLVVTERFNARLVRVDKNGALSVLADRWPPTTGLPLSAPNDVTVRLDGNIYFTDSDWGANPAIQHAAMGVYRIAPDGTLSRILDLDKPNGVALSPDGSTLYVGSDTQAKIWKLPLDASGAPTATALLIDGATIPGGMKVPDGICVDDGGNLFVAANADETRAIVVFNPAGQLLGRIPVAANPSNCSFGGDDRRTLYITTLHAVYEVRMPKPGRP
jgi:gluconolactonase